MSTLKFFVIGGTGLLGKAVVERLLASGSVTMMLRPGSRERRADDIEKLEHRARQLPGELRFVAGDIEEKGLGLTAEGRAALSDASHCFHLAALYDLHASEDELKRVNVDGTANVIATLGELEFTGHLQYASSVGIMGDFDGTFTEAMFSEGQRFAHPYLRTKHEAEALVRESTLEYRIYRPSSVVGDSRTGEMDRIDGVYYSFAGLKAIARIVPTWLPVPAPRLKDRFNLVPVDYVADAMVHISLNDSGDRRVFHLVDPKPPTLVKQTELFLKAAGGPRLLPIMDPSKVPGLGNILRMASAMPAVTELLDSYFQDAGLPGKAALDAMNTKVRCDTSNTDAALKDSGISCPRLKKYARKLFRYYEDHLDPVLHRADRYPKALADRVVLITGASRGIGVDVARIAAKAGATVLLVARDAGNLENVANTIREAGGTAHVYPTDLTKHEEIDKLAAAVLSDHGGVDVLIHNAARSIRRPIADSTDRFHDFERTMALNYFSPVRLTLALLPSLQQRGGTVSMVLTVGVLIPGPFFGAYLSSKAALSAFGDSLASENRHHGFHVSSVYLPLVKTDMMAPTAEYADRNDLMTTEKAARMILDGVVHRERRVMPPIGRFYTVANGLNPKGTTRFLNILQRVFPADGPSEFPIEKAMISKALGGSPI